MHQRPEMALIAASLCKHSFPAYLHDATLPDTGHKSPSSDSI